MCWTCGWDAEMNRLIIYLLESTKTLQTEITWSSATADAKILQSRLHTRSQTLLNGILICTKFISVNAFLKFWSSGLILVIHGYEQHVSKVELHLSGLRNKWFMFTIKEVWDQVCSPENQFLSPTIVNGRPRPLWKVLLGSDEVLMSYYLFICSFNQHVQHMTSQILLILIDFVRDFDHFLIWNNSSLNCYNSGDIKKY